jgi:hypothetical protein
MNKPRAPWVALLFVLAGGRVAAPQGSREYGGFFEASFQGYARTPEPSDTHALGAGRFQVWSRGTVGNHLGWRGMLDFRLDTHGDVDRHRWLDFAQRGLLQPAGAVRELYADLKVGHVDLRIGKQEIRWGRADGFNPTDNLVPYDYLNTFADERIPVGAAKADCYVRGARFEAVWLPSFTPSRLPRVGQRWFPSLPSTATGSGAPDTAPIPLSYGDGSTTYPARTLGNSQWALRWNQLVPRAEFSVSYFDGLDDLPYFTITPQPFPEAAPSTLILLNRSFYRVQVAGADFASSIGPFGVRAEAAFFNQNDPANHDHFLFVAGVDRTWGDWFVILQYTDQAVAGTVSNTAVFPDLGLKSTMLLRVERTLAPAASVELKSALQLRNGDFLLQALYSRALTNDWRLKIGTTLFVGPRETYLGQFRDNGYLNLQLTYSF